MLIRHRYLFIIKMTATLGTCISSCSDSHATCFADDLGIKNMIASLYRRLRFLGNRGVLLGSRGVLLGSRGVLYCRILGRCFGLGRLTICINSFTGIGNKLMHMKSALSVSGNIQLAALCKCDICKVYMAVTVSYDQLSVRINYHAALSLCINIYRV